MISAQGIETCKLCNPGFVSSKD